jgi:ABC-type transport system substrate-binding protein
MDDTHPSLYEVAMPAINVIPDLAEPPEPPTPRQDGEIWIVDVPLREDAVWSDGHPITAGDVAFTFDVIASGQGVGVCGGWWWQASAVAAVDDHTVRITFDSEPGLATWPHGIGVGSWVIPEHFWAPQVEAAQAAGMEAVEAILDPAAAIWEAQQKIAEATGDDFTRTVEDITQEEIDAFLGEVYNTTLADALAGLSATEEPSGGPLVFADWEPGLSLRFVANPRFYRSGEEVHSGDTTYTIGPFIDEYRYVVYGSDYAAHLAFLRGEADYTSVAGSPAVDALIHARPDITPVANSTNDFWYLGFNLRKPPMSDLAFRRALAMMIDREFMARDVLQGAVSPAWTLLPEANLQYFDLEAAAGIASKYRNLDRFERLEAAVAMLEEAGFTWERKPTVGKDDRGELSVEPGSGIRMPDGTPPPQLEILTITVGLGLYYVFPTYGLYIERWLRDLGFSARVQVSSGQYLVGKVWPGIGVEPTFDLVLLGWNAGNPAFPTFHEAFFHSRWLAEVNDGNNAVGYVNPGFDQLADQILQTKTPDEAKRIIWQLEAIIDRDLPYLVLMNPVAREAFANTRVEYPFTDTLGGLWRYPLIPGLVRIRE